MSLDKGQFTSPLTHTIKQTPQKVTQNNVKNSPENCLVEVYYAILNQG